VQFCAPVDGRKNRLKHVLRLTEINKLRKFASCWLYSENILAMHGPMNVTAKGNSYLAKCCVLIVRCDNGKFLINSTDKMRLLSKPQKGFCFFYEEAVFL